MNRNIHNYKFYLDISGTVRKSKDNIYIGCLMMNDRFRSAFREKFYHEFPSLRSFNKKGSSLDHERLKKILQFLEDNKVKASVIILKRHLIKKSEIELKSKIKEVKKIRGEVSLKDFEERLVGLAYFYAIKQHAKQGYLYDSIHCMESQFKIQQAFVALDRISYKKKYNIRPACTPRRIEHMLKFADFAASAGRKIDKFILDQFKYFKVIQYTPSQEDWDIVFNMSRREKNNRKV